jgi:translocation and assembly module TamA
VVPLGAGRIDSWRNRAGKVRLLNLAVSQEQITETIYIESLFENDDFDRVTSRFGPQLPLIFVDDPSLEDELGLGEGKFSLSLGIDYDWPVINGRGFDTQGHRIRTWLFTANEAWGSDSDFTQFYISGRWNRVFGQRWKVLLRGEVGYTDATVNELTLSLAGQPFDLSVTELPFVYRFRAGGSNSLRGYDFEQLSNNGIGSNNIITASAELEYKLRGNWAGAAFYDVGNAFNDWSERDLKRGVGVGLRWYTVAGAVRLDYAQALDLQGEPWRIHLSIGSPLL